MYNNLPLSFRLLRLYFHYLGLLAPLAAAKQAQKIWIKTRRYPIPKRELPWLEAAQQEQLNYQHHRINYYHWGSGSKKILMVHGWNGHATQMAAFAQPLVDAGYKVYSVDLPSHGESTGDSTNGVECAAALHGLEERLGAFDAVISHSFGAFCSLYNAANGLLSGKIIAISSPADVSFLIDVFTKGIDIPEKSILQFRRLLEEEFGTDFWQRFNVGDAVKGMKHTGLLVHDEGDRLVPIRNSELLHQNWPGSRLIRTRGLGHHRILRDKKVIEDIRSFLTNEPTC